MYYPDICTNLTNSNVAGLKVIGGKVSDTGQLGAFISKVKKGSIADTVGHLRPGELPSYPAP